MTIALTHFRKVATVQNSRLLKMWAFLVSGDLLASSDCTEYCKFQSAFSTCTHQLSKLQDVKLKKVELFAIDLTSMYMWHCTEHDMYTIQISVTINILYVLCEPLQIYQPKTSFNAASTSML